VGLVVITAREGDGTHVALEPDTPGAVEFIEAAVVECRTHRGQDHVIIKIPRLRGMKFIRRNGVTIRLEVAPGSDVEVVSASGPVELNGPLGVADVKTASGDITADDVEEMQAKTASGDVEVGTVGGALRCVRVDGRASVKTASGDVEIGSAADHTEVRGSSGDVRLGDVAGDLSVIAVSGDIHVLSIARGRAQLRSVSGAVEAGVARGVALHVDAESMSGSVHSDIPLNDAPGQSGGESKVELTVRTVSGNILVTRAAEAFVR
jgi:DUF4097 and DUF4098 domain-containing protein YvlB